MKRYLFGHITSLISNTIYLKALIIGGIQVLLNYVGISVFDKLKIKQKQRRIADGLATVGGFLDVMSILQNEKGH